MTKTLCFGTFLFLFLVPLIPAQEKQASCSTFGYELLAARLDALENVAMKSQLKSTGDIQNLRNDVQELTRNIQSSMWIHSGEIIREGNGLTVSGWYDSVCYELLVLNRQTKCLSLGLPRSCSEVLSRKSGIHRLAVSRGIKTTFDVYCDQEFEGGGWLVFQNRFNGAVNFYRPWAEYKEGFGSLDGEFWLGLDKLHEITYSAQYELAIVVEGFDGDKAVARYSEFAIGSEVEFYNLSKLGTYSGTANDSLTYHSGVNFSTFDRDNDEHDSNCALTYIGAWWYKACHYSNLNSRYGSQGLPNRIVVWRKWKGDSYALKKTRMMIRQKSLS
ncbi:microfibril-associated glycoprotein 4-like [Ochlerotatus camptorhynchus]|uniref:microfibril-associated glycoprotein 4-like n=1 Tax=Ochlerotatus camptorhynchus TaxID=644619 RepID=UPI0031D384ED